MSFDEKVKPLLNAEQQVKFQALRDALRARVLEKIASGAGAKLEASRRSARGCDEAGPGVSKGEAGESLALTSRREASRQRRAWLFLVATSRNRARFVAPGASGFARSAPRNPVFK